MKSNLDLVQELLDSRIESLGEKMDMHNKHVLELLTRVEIQTTKTNGRVTDLEKEVKTLRDIENKHVVNCPRIADIEEINEKLDKMDEDNLIVKVWNKYPKQFLAVIIIGVVMTIATIGYTLYQIHYTIKNVQTEHTTS